MSRPKASKPEPAKVTLPAVNCSGSPPAAKASPGWSITPLIAISPCPPRKPNAAGADMEKVEPLGVAVVKTAPSAKISCWAVEKWAALGTLIEAPWPNTMPDGLMNQKLALGMPLVVIWPSMNEVWPPVTRLMTLVIWAPSPWVRNQTAVSPAARLKVWKLWNRLVPARVPPSTA